MCDNRSNTEFKTGKGEGIYLFCFARPDLIPTLKVGGLDEGSSVLQCAFKDVVAVLSKVSLEEFCGPSAESRMKDLSWVGPRACRHEEAVEQVTRHSPVFPARFGTIFSSLESLKKFLRKHHRAILEFLDQIADKDEWSVKGLMDRAKARDELLSVVLDRQSADLDSLSPGKRYFQEQRIRNDVEKELNRYVRGVSKGIWNDLGRYASDFAERKVFSRDLTGEDGDMILNWAFLVPRKLVSDFRARLDQANEAHKHQGLTLVMSGPWPPYSFCPSLGTQ